MKSLFRPTVIIYGLEISSSAIHLVWLERNKLKKESVALGPGIIKDGRLKNREKFLEAFLNLRPRLDGGGIIPTVISIPANNVQVRSFNLPAVSETDLPAAAALNLQMISPIDVRTAYYDWQKLSVQGGEFLGAFVRRDIADEYFAVLNEAGFEAVAVEFPALAIARLIKEQSAAADLSKPQIVLTVSSDGLEFLVVKNGELAFSHFVPNSSTQHFNETITKELEKTFDVYPGNNLILIAPSLHQEIERAVKEKYPQLRVRTLALEGLAGLAPVWYAALGSALRSRFLKSENKIINLVPTAGIGQFRKLELRAFIGSWQKVILIVLYFLSATFLVSAVSLAVFSYQLTVKVESGSKTPEALEVNSLQGKATQFNNLVAKVSAAKNQSNDWSPVLKELSNIAKSLNIVLAQVSIDGPKTLVSGKAETELEVLGFKTKLIAKENLFKNVNLPLSNIISNKDKTVSFSLNFEI